MITSSPRNGKILFWILAACLAARLAAVALFQPPLFSDDIDYVAIGKSFAAGGGYVLEGHPTAYRPPGYPLLLAASFTVFGESLFPVRAAQAFADLLSCLLVYLIGRKLLGERVGLVAAGIFALFPIQILYVPIMMTETLFTTLLLLYVLICTGETASWKRSIAAGVVLGAATLVRPTVLLLPAAVFAVRWKGGWPRGENIRSLAVTAAAALIVCSPWMVRNLDEFGRLSLTSNTGVNFWMGNHHGASGSYSYPPDNPLVAVKDEYGASALGMALGFAFIRDHPLEEATLLAKKWAHFFSVDYWLLQSLNYRPDFKSAPNAGVVFSRFPVAQILILHLPFAAVLLLATFGLCCHARTDRSGLIVLFAPVAYWVSVHLVFYAAARYRFPVVPLFMIGAAYGVESILRKTYVRTALRAALAAFFALLFTAGWIAERIIIHRQADASERGAGSEPASGKIPHAGHDLEMSRLPTSWDEGIPLGNGLLGARAFSLRTGVLQHKQFPPQRRPDALGVFVVHVPAVHARREFCICRGAPGDAVAELRRAHQGVPGRPAGVERCLVPNAQGGGCLPCQRTARGGDRPRGADRL